jgi:hypothetical protein
MSVTPAEFLDLAERLGAGDVTEILLRTAANRAYYAAYHTGLAAVDRTEYDKRGNLKFHARLIASLAAGDERQRRIGTALKKGRSLRALADYEISAPFDRNHFTRLLGFARNIARYAQDA